MQLLATWRWTTMPSEDLCRKTEKSEHCPGALPRFHVSVETATQSTAANAAHELPAGIAACLRC